MDSARAMDGRTGAREAGRGVAVVHLAALAGAVVVIGLTAGSTQWHLTQLLVVSVFAVASDLTAVETHAVKVRISGSFLGIMLAAVLLGGGPAALVGLLTIAIGRLRTREAAHYFRNNLATFAWAPLLSGLCFHTTVHALHLGTRDLGYYLVVFAVFILALALNFVGVAGFQCYLERSSLPRKLHEVLMPVLSAELFSALLTVAAVFVAVRTGTAGIILFGLVLAIFQYLAIELLKSKRRGDDLHRMATTDELTDLPNREFFRAELADRIAAAKTARESFAVMLIDLDRFKEVNDTLGHHYGDELLRQVGPRLARCVGADGLVARMGGDEFAVMSDTGTGEIEVLEGIAAELIACVQEAVVVDELSLEVGASIGISRYPADGRDAHSLLRRADVAMYAAKESHSGFKIYAAELDRHSMRRLSVLSDFRRALGSDEIVVYYQPIVDVGDEHVRAAEGLVRWNHPELGVLPPGAFMQIVEQTGLIGPMTRLVLERAIEQCAQWRRSGRQLSVAVNLSVRNLLDRNLPAEIEHMLDAYGLPPAALQLEITESMLMADPERAVATVTRLSGLGAQLSVDDFGTGYSSLANLRRLPIDELKIDRSFVSPMLRDESDLIIVRSTINLGHDLGLRVIAEGVEDEPTLKRLAHLGCDLAQGYQISRPLPSDAFARWLDDTGQSQVLQIAV
jgi:diguanylate cyclase (GGDEF)-like protein